MNRKFNTIQEYVFMLKLKGTNGLVQFDCDIPTTIGTPYLKKNILYVVTIVSLNGEKYIKFSHDSDDSLLHRIHRDHINKFIDHIEFF